VGGALGMRTIHSASIAVAAPLGLATAYAMDAIGRPVLNGWLNHSVRVVAWQKKQEASPPLSCL
jgi:hypothetical protein